MANAAGRRYRMSFLRVMLCIYPFLFALGILLVALDPASVSMDFLYCSLAFLPVAAVPALLIVLLQPVTVSVEGIVTKPQADREQLTPWGAILRVRPSRFLFVRCVKAFCDGRPAPLWLPLDMQGRPRFVEDLKQSAPAGNPLRVFLESGDLIERPATAGNPAAVASAPADAGGSQPEQNAGIPAAAEDPAVSDAGAGAARHRLESQRRSGANWFYWIAGLSVINTVTVLLGWEGSFVAGLCATQIIDGFSMGLAQEIGGKAGIVIHAAAVFLNLMIAGCFVLFGVFANKRHGWSFLTGFVLYALDAVLFLLFAEWLAVLIHLVALYGIFAGFLANKKLSKGAVA